MRIHGSYHKKMHINHVEIEARLQNDLACPSLFFSNWVIAVVQVANILVRKFIQKMPMHVLKNHWDCCDFAAGDCRLLPLLTLLFLSILFLLLLLLLCCCCCYRYCSWYLCRSRCFHHSLSLCDIQQFAYNFDYSLENLIWM